MVRLGLLDGKAGASHHGVSFIELRREGVGDEQGSIAVDRALLAGVQPAIGDPVNSAMVYFLNPSGHSSATVKRQWYLRDGSLPFRTSPGQADAHTNMTFYRDDSASPHSHHDA
jgi:hypothetical protein